MVFVQGEIGMFQTGLEVRRACREGSWTGPTCGLAPGYSQANLVMLPQDWAFDFLLFCQRNPQPLPAAGSDAGGIVDAANHRAGCRSAQ